jgi:dTDP-4-amino-4,6-dideoxygalactose transaminase
VLPFSPAAHVNRVPFTRAFVSGREHAYMADALRTGCIAGDGIFTRKCEALLEQALGEPRARVLLTTSCTHALEMAALLLEIGPGDEVIIPSFTFVSTANAFVSRGAVPVFVDVRADTLNLDERALRWAVTARTRAIVPVHIGGVGCAMNEILSIARDRGVAVVEDNAHGLFATSDGKSLGSFGLMGTYSFHDSKNFSCGEGGALVVSDGSLVRRAEVLREKGTNRRLFSEGQIDHYTWIDIGSSFAPSDLLAAYLLAQLESRETITTKRRAIWTRYRDELRDWATTEGVRMQEIPPHCEPSWHVFYLILPNRRSRDALRQHLQDRGIEAHPHYEPLHLSPMGRTHGGAPGQCPVTEQITAGLLRLPMFTELTQENQDYVIQNVSRFSTSSC